MRHRWSTAFTDSKRLTARAIIHSGAFVRIRNMGTIGTQESEGSDHSDGIVQIVRLIQPGNWVRGLRDFRKSGSEKMYGSLMNRFAIPLRVCRNTIAVGLGAVLIFSTFSVPVSAADSAKKLFVLGQSAENREDYDAAYEAYRKAYAKSPNDLRMRAAYYRLRQTASSVHVTQGRKLLDKGDENAALAQFLRATEIDPGNEAAIQEVGKIRSKQSPVPVRGESSLSDAAEQSIEGVGAPAELKLVSDEPLTLNMTQDSKVIYQAIGKAAGINVLFDPDYNGKRIPIELTNVSLMDALRIVGTISNTFWRPITENTIFVAANTRAKRTELDEQAVQTFYLSNAWQTNDLNDVQTALRNVLGGNVKVYGVPSQNAIVVRATPDELTLTQKIINDLDKARPEVVVDVAIMEVDKDKLRNIGLSWPGSISFALQPPTSSTTSTTTSTTGTTTTNALTLDNLANLNANNFAVTVSSATANLLLSDSDTKILQNPRIRATDGQKATMKIGQKIPIATGSYQTGATTAITSSLVNTQFQYQDVGVNIEMTPTVHFDHDVTLKLKIEDSSEAGTETISGVTQPIFAQKTSEQTIRLREGESSILSGILDKQDIVSSSGIPFLSELPLFKYIFGSKSHEVIDDEVVFVLTPHVVRGQELSPLNLRRIDTGSGQTIELRRTASNQVKPVQGTPNAAQAQPYGVQNRPASGLAPLKGQTAEAAVSSAMAQLRQQSESGVPNLGGTPPAQAPLAQAAPSQPAGPVGASAPSPISFVLTPPATAPAAGANFPLAVTLNGAKDISAVPLQIQYDASKLTLINVDGGDLLGKDGQAIALVHRDDGPGMITIAASRPPGTAGVSGSGAVCVLTFQAKQAGESDVIITHPGAMDSAQRPVAASAQNAHIVVK
jgi:general secretion pathway protein D